MPFELSDDLMRHVVSFVADRHVRCALGYDVDACIKWRIPPLPLSVNETFVAILDVLRFNWLPPNGVFTITADDVLIRSEFIPYHGPRYSPGPGVVHTIYYRNESNAKLWRVSKVLKYYRHDYSTGTS